MPVAAPLATFLGPAWSAVARFFTHLDREISLVGVVAAGIAAVSLIVYGGLFIASRHRRTTLVAVLDPYRVAPSGQQGRIVEEPESVLTLRFLRRLSGALEDAIGETRAGRWLRAMLERAGVQVPFGELAGIWLVTGVLLVALGWLLAGLVGLAILLVLALVGPVAVLQGLVDRRAALFASQLPDVLKLTASSLRAGFSLLQGLDAVTRQVRDPSRSELQRVLAEARLGRPVEDALEDAAARIRNRDFAESVAAVRIQQEAGGNLATLFDMLAATMQQRLRLRREVRTLTAEGRASAWILAVLPVALGAFILAVNRPYILELVHSLPGRVMLIGGLLLEIVGFWWMNRIVKIDA